MSSLIAVLIAYILFGCLVAAVGSTKLTRMGEGPFDTAEWAVVVLFWPYIILSSILEE